MFEILAKFFKFSGKENGNKFKLSIVIGLVEALASAMKIPAIMYILIGLISEESMGKYIGGSIAIMGIAIVTDIICKRFSTVLQTEGGYNASAFMRIKPAPPRSLPGAAPKTRAPGSNLLPGIPPAL